MRFYELNYFLSPDLKEEDVKKTVEEINSFLQKESGVIEESKSLSLKTLAYPIKKQKTALWGTLNFHFPPEKLNDFKENLRKRSEILRFLLTIKKIPKKKPIRKAQFKKTAPPQIEAESKETSEKKAELKEIDKKLEEILRE